MSTKVLSVVLPLARSNSWKRSYLFNASFNFRSTYLLNRKMSTSTGWKVFITLERVPQIGVDLLKSSGCSVTQWDGDAPISKDDLIKAVRGCDGLFCSLRDQIDKDVLDAAGPNLKVIGTVSVGYEHIDLAECRSRQIKLGYTPNVLTDATADTTVGLLLATSRNFFPAARAVKSGEWGPWNPLWMCGPGIKGSTVGIVGLGRIGLAVARRLVPFGVKKILYSGHSSKPHASEVNAELVPFTSLMTNADFVIATCPLTPETTGLFNRAAFSLMKNTAIFINTSRGGVVNQDDLYDALTSGQIAAAGLDVTSPEPLPPDHKLLTLENCVVLPHIGSAVIETRSEMAKLTAQNILAALGGHAMPSELKQ